MSDFLTNLVARSAESQPQMLPRQAAHFEAGIAAPGPLAFGEGADEMSIGLLPAALQGERPNSAEQPPAALRPGAAPGDRPGPVELSPAARQPDDKPDPPAQNRRPAPRQEPRAPGRRASTPARAPSRSGAVGSIEPPARQAWLSGPAPEMAEPLERVIQPRPAAEQQIRPAARSLVPPIPADRHSSLQRHKQLSPTLLAEQQADRPTTGLAEAAIPRAASAPVWTLAGEHAAVLPQVQPYLAPEPPATAPPALPVPAAPTIHVTIGRVEVRASSAPTRRERGAARQPSVLTLDEYLRRRRGGR
jgi:hypothetical protein